MNFTSGATVYHSHLQEFFSMYNVEKMSDNKSQQKEQKQENQQEDLLAQAQKVVDELDKIQPMTVEEQEQESAKTSPVGQDQDKDSEQK